MEGLKRYRTLLRLRDGDGAVAGTAAGNALGGQLVDGASFDAAVLAAGGVAAAGALLALRIR